MDIMDTSNTDDYFVTAMQIFDYCGTDNSGRLRVDSLMDKFAPFVKTNKAEYSYLRSLLDPEQCNPEINVAELARALNKYSESQKSKVDFDESFNLKCGQVPQDSDSGISSDGFQHLEDLQCELREKSHLISQLRNQLEFTDRQHEEALATLTAERDSLRAHLILLRDENMSLLNARRDCEEASERLCGSEAALGDVTRELEALRRKHKGVEELAAALENDKQTLTEQLSISKAECHRINDMYAGRQAALLEQNEALSGECAELAAGLSDQRELLHQLVSEKVLLEMELKDMLNKSNLTHHRLDRSVDVSYTEEQMLTALDSLNADSRFVQEHHLLDEESFTNALKEEHPSRATNMSLYDEIRLSFGNMSRSNILDFKDHCDKSHDSPEKISKAIQTEGVNNEITSNFSNGSPKDHCEFHDSPEKISKAIQTEESNDSNNEITGNDSPTDHQKISEDMQTEEMNDSYNEIKNSDTPKHCKECEQRTKYAIKLESNLKRSRINIASMQSEYEDNLQILQNFVEEGNHTNNLLQKDINKLQAKLDMLETSCVEQRNVLDKLSCETTCAQCQTESELSPSVSTQVDQPCWECDKRVTGAKSWKRFLWDGLTSLFSVFAGVCLVSALILLYNVSNYHYAARRCIRESPTVPWRWLNIHDLFDFVFRIEYVGEVPM